MNILIIEDDDAIRETLQVLLEINGHTVTAAADGIAGVKLAAARPDLILCDIGMPGMDGYQALTKIRELPQGAEIPFIFLTARADRDHQRRGMALGADDYITKPFTEREIMDAIQARTRRQRPLRERVEQLVAARKREISADWAHELMTPLNGIMGGLAMIEAEADSIQPAELKVLLGLIRGGAERQYALSRKLVLYYELERLRATPPSQPYRCDAARVTSSSAAQAAADAKRPGDLALRCEPGVVALAEPHLSAAVAELVANAFRFTSPGQKVGVTATEHAGRYQIEITDDGPGLTAEQRASAADFTQFERKKREQQGLGLGLAIARTTAELGGGRLILDAVGPGDHGLKVTLDLPVG